MQQTRTDIMIARIDFPDENGRSLYSFYAVGHQLTLVYEDVSVVVEESDAESLEEAYDLSE